MLTVAQIAAIVVGAFYVFAGVVVLRAMTLDRVMNQLLAALNDPSAPQEVWRSRVLRVGAFLTLASGAALMLLSPLALLFFAASAVWQGGYLLWAERALPPEDDDEARGRRQTKNAFVVYVAATAFVVWLAAQGHLRAWDVPLQTLGVDAAIVAAVGAASWLLIQMPRGNQPSALEPEPEAEPQPVASRVWMVFRSDDAGNVFLVGDELDEAEATALAETLAERGHKQTYTIHPYDDYEERAALMAQFKVQV